MRSFYNKYFIAKKNFYVDYVDYIRELINYTYVTCIEIFKKLKK